jgi:hypothetical protein
MYQDQDEIDERAGFVSLSKASNAALGRVERTYSTLVTSLTIGNAGASVATLGFIGATWSGGHFYRPTLIPLALFVLGAVSVGVGLLFSLLRDTRRLARFNRIPSSPARVVMRQQDLPSPLEDVGLSFSNTATIGAVLSSVCFVAGCVVGFMILLG